MNIENALDSIEAGRQIIKKLNQADPCIQYETAVIHLNAAKSSLATKTIAEPNQPLPSQDEPVTEPKKKKKKVSK